MEVCMAPSKTSRNKPSDSSNVMTANFLFFLILFTIMALLLLLTRTSYICNYETSASASASAAWSGDLRGSTFAWNRLSFHEPPPLRLRIAVFSRKWPTTSAPGGMERQAYGLHSTLSGRGHDVHVFTSPTGSSPSGPSKARPDPHGPTVYFHEAAAAGGHWRPDKAWDMFVEENKRAPFDVVHSESVALPHHLARHLPNLAVSWHGIGLELLQSAIFQDLARPDSEPMTPIFNNTIRALIPRVLNEIRFFHSYAHHVATSDSCGEILRDVYQIPNKRVHVILNGVSENDFKPDLESRSKFRSKIGVPENATLVLGAVGRLVRDKGHPILYVAFSRLIKKNPNVYLVVAGSGPWGDRYRDLGPQAKVLGPMSTSELGGFYNGIDIFVSPTMRPQGLDLTFLEAMMSGKPVMGSRFPSIKGSIVVEKELGFMFAPNEEELEEALEEVVLEGAERLAERGQACRRYAERMFTTTKMALAYERLFLCVKNSTFCTYR